MPTYEKCFPIFSFIFYQNEIFINKYIALDKCKLGRDSSNFIWNGNCINEVRKYLNLLLLNEALTLTKQVLRAKHSFILINYFLSMKHYGRTNFRQMSY